MKCCRKTNIYKAVQFKPGVEDGFKIVFWDDRFIYLRKGEKEPDPKTVQYRIPYIEVPYEREPGFAHGYKPQVMHDNSWILTDWNGCIQIWQDKDFRTYFSFVEETNEDKI